MKIKNFTLLMVATMLAVPFASFGQRTCGSNEYMMQQMQTNPRFAEKVAKIEAGTQQYLKSAHLKAAAIITIPVHVIVVYANASQNISDAQIQSQISVLNLDYRKLNTDWPNTPAEFIDKVADVQVQFVLQGIERHSNSTASWGLNDAVKAAFPPYSPNTHLNFWVANIGSGYLGYAQFPGGAPATDGVVISPQYFGSKTYTDGTFNLASPYDLGRTATHEVGHWLNLRHIWGDGTCATDYVDDTPTAQQANYGCPTHPHYTCGSDDMFMNYMDYTDDGCMYMFTNGQTSRIKAIFDTGGPRESFVNGGVISCAATACNGNIGLSLTFDNYPSETSWTLVSENGTTIDQGSGYTVKGQTIAKNWTLSQGKYTFTVYDSYGDGFCCAYGNGSYTLKDGCGTTLKSGASFGTSESIVFCVPGDTTNTPPVAEANGPYSGTTGTAITFSSTGSVDSNGIIAGYSWNFGDGSTSTLQNPTHAYTAAGTYTVILTVTDNSGATATDQATVTVTSSGVTTTELSYSDFESGWGIWSDGGADCARYTSTTYAYGGTSALDIQDNSGTASSFYHTTGVDVATPGYSSITVDFYFYAVSMETGEDFWVQYYNGTTWATVSAFVSGTNFNNNTFYHATVTISKASYTFPTNMKIRFMCDASDNNDDVYIDNIRITATKGTAKESGVLKIEALDNLKAIQVTDQIDNFMLSPNPAGNTLNVSIGVDENTTLYMYNLNGKLLETRKLTNDITPLDISKLYPGVYLIKVSTGKDVYTKKFIKK